jgi:hypothetical protein
VVRPASVVPVPPSLAFDVDVLPDVSLVLLPLLLDPVAPVPVVPLLEVCAPEVPEPALVLLPEPALVWAAEPVCVVLSCPEPWRPGEAVVPQPTGANAVAEIKTSNLDCVRCICRSLEERAEGAP